MQSATEGMPSDSLCRRHGWRIIAKTEANQSSYTQAGDYLQNEKYTDWPTILSQPTGVMAEDDIHALRLRARIRDGFWLSFIRSQGGCLMIKSTEESSRRRISETKAPASTHGTATVPTPTPRAGKRRARPAPTYTHRSAQKSDHR